MAVYLLFPWAVLREGALTIFPFLKAFFLKGNWEIVRAVNGNNDKGEEALWNVMAMLDLLGTF